LHRTDPGILISEALHFGKPIIVLCLLLVFGPFLDQLARPVSMVPNIPGIPGPPVNSSGSISPSGHPMPSEAKMVSTSQPGVMFALLKEMVISLGFSSELSKRSSGARES
jgi:hypothetical protein